MRLQGLLGEGKITALAFVGDSTTAEALFAPIQPYGTTGTAGSLGLAWANCISWALGREIRIVYDTTTSPSLVSFARSGVKSDHVLETQIPAILNTSDELPSHVVWKIGTNDVSHNYSIVSSEANIRDGIALLKDAGIRSIITTINPRRLDSGKTEEVAEFNDLLQTIADDTSSIFVSHELLLEGEDNEGTGEEFLGVLYDGVHQWQHTSLMIAKDFVDQTSKLYPKNLVNPFDLGPLLHTHANITNTLPSGVTTSIAYVSRDDGIAGNFYRCNILSSPSLTIGTGNSGVSYTPVSPETNSTIAIYHRTSQFNGPFSNGGLPQISVLETTNGRKFIEVRAEMSSSTVVTSTASNVVTAVNNNPAASALVTASLVGNGTGLMAPGSGFSDWSLTLSAASTDPAAGSWVRAICEVKVRDPMRSLCLLRLWRQTPLNATLRSIPAGPAASTMALEPHTWVFWTPWYQVQEGDSGWRAQFNFGQEEGTVDIGRFSVQVYDP